MGLQALDGHDTDGTCIASEPQDFCACNVEHDEAQQRAEFEVPPLASVRLEHPPKDASYHEGHHDQLTTASMCIYHEGHAILEWIQH